MLIFQGLYALALYDLLNMFCRFETICRVIKNQEVASRTFDRRIIDQVCAAINIACAWYPKMALCLQRAFVTTRVLRKHGVRAELVMGAQKLPFKAHAWVEIDGRAINERSNVQTTYAVWERC